MSGSCFAISDQELSRAARASHFSFGKSNQNHVRRTLAETIKLFRYPVLLSEHEPARTRASMRSDMRALLPRSLPVLGSLYGAKSKVMATAVALRANFASSNSPCMSGRSFRSDFQISLFDDLFHKCFGFCGAKPFLRFGIIGAGLPTKSGLRWKPVLGPFSRCDGHDVSIAL